MATASFQADQQQPGVCAVWKSWRAALLFEVICAFAHLPSKGLSLSPEGASSPVPVQCSAARGYSLGPLSCCEACSYTVKSHFSCGFTPHELFSNFVGGTVQQDVFMG